MRFALSLQAALCKQTLHFRLKFGKQAIESPATRVEDDGALRTQLGELKPCGFAHPASNPVADDCFPERFGSGETNSRGLPGRIHEAESGEIRTGVTRPVVVNLSEFAGSKEPDTFGKT